MIYHDFNVFVFRDNVRKLSDGVARSLLGHCEVLEILSFIDCPKLSAACLSDGASSSITSVSCGSSNAQISNAIDHHLFDQMSAHALYPQILKLQNCSGILHLRGLSACTCRIHHLQLSNAQSIPAEQFELLKLLPQTLKVLDLSHSPISNIGFLSHFQNLMHICLTGCPVPAAQLCDILPQCQHLRVIDLSASNNNHFVSDKFANTRSQNEFPGKVIQRIKMKMIDQYLNH